VVVSTGTLLALKKHGFPATFHPRPVHEADHVTDTNDIFFLGKCIEFPSGCPTAGSDHKICDVKLRASFDSQLQCILCINRSGRFPKHFLSPHLKSYLCMLILPDFDFFRQLA
jgi:hypothetical protein